MVLLNLMHRCLPIWLRRITLKQRCLYVPPWSYVCSRSNGFAPARLHSKSDGLNHNLVSLTVPDEALQDLALLIHCSPEVVHLAVDLYVHFIEVPAPLAEASHADDLLTADVGSKQRAKPVPPVPHGFVADVDPALEQQILYVT